ncbi:hypothetical protein EYF80_033875 [Liparis tanakae]|uniref:Uncharacterized protein n=1 Tax=Liparis tanakae TaxID=230148 RepID=A0A4Z2GQY4_9TELE|nr:hypothetical protein EYF80_033875 [Liparis tanakae]
MAWLRGILMRSWGGERNVFHGQPFKSRAVGVALTLQRRLSSRTHTPPSKSSSGPADGDQYERLYFLLPDRMTNYVRHRAAAEDHDVLLVKR